MEFIDLKKIDKFGAFNKFKSVEEAKRIEWIPKEYHNIFPQKCECGSEMIINEELTQLQCCNPRCYIKLGWMLYEMFSRFGCKNVGPATCKSIMKELIKKKQLKYPSHIEVLSLNPAHYPLSVSGAKSYDFERAIVTILSSKLTLAQIVSKLGIPELEETGWKIFSSSESIMDLVKMIKEENGLKAFMAHRGYSDKMLLFYLSTFMEDIALAQILMQDNIRGLANSTMSICITGSVAPNGVSMNKAKYIELLNDAGTTSTGERLIEVKMTSAKQSVPYIVADYPSGTDKYNVGKARGVLITSTELLDKIKEVVSDYEREKKRIGQG